MLEVEKHRIQKVELEGILNGQEPAGERVETAADGEEVIDFIG